MNLQLYLQVVMQQGSDPGLHAYARGSVQEVVDSEGDEEHVVLEHPPRLVLSHAVHKALEGRVAGGVGDSKGIELWWAAGLDPGVSAAEDVAQVLEVHHRLGSTVGCKCGCQCVVAPACLCSTQPCRTVVEHGGLDNSCRLWSTCNTAGEADQAHAGCSRQYRVLYAFLRLTSPAEAVRSPETASSRCVSSRALLAQAGGR